MCSNSRNWHCWNSMGFDGRLAVRRIVSAITDELVRLDGFEDQFNELVRRAQQDRMGGVADELRKLEREEAALAREKANFTDAIRRFGAHPMLSQQLDDIDVRERALNQRRDQLEYRCNRELQLPGSITDLRNELQKHFLSLSMDSPEFGDLMRQLVPEFHVYLVRLADGGHPLPRARVRLSLAGSISDAVLVPDLESLLSRELTIDLFERPSQRERIREEAVRLAGQGLTQQQIAAQLADESPKLPVVQQALALDQKMKELHLDTPYILVANPPLDYPKLRRWKNAKYEFLPREGYQPPAL